MVNEQRWWTLTLLGLALSTTGCGGSDSASPAKAVPPATVAGAVTEAALTTITLTVEAVSRLGVETAMVEERSLTRTRTLGGEVMPAGGAQTTVTAPVAGVLELAGGGAAVGTRVRQGTTVMRIVPLAPAERDVRIEAERVVSEAVGRQTMAAQRERRATQLASDGSGSRRAAEEAQADLVVANAALEAARNRLALAARGVSATGGLALVAPHDGVVRAMFALPGQTVAASAPLFDLVRLDTVWIRVPLYAGDVDTVDRRAAVQVVPIGADASETGVTVRPVAAPPSADAAAAAIDLYYAAPNSDGAFRPGQRVGVRVPLGGPSRALVVPRASVLHDAQGGSWVYEARQATVFVRRRVSVVDMVGAYAVIAAGPAVGTRVVTLGAAELFGTEFGVGK